MDKRLNNVDDLIVVRGFLESLYNLLEDPSPPDLNSDVFTTAINCPKGTLLEAYFFVSLRTINLVNNDKDKRDEFWSEIQNFYHFVFKQNKSIVIILSSYLGKYFPNYMFMSKEWASDKYVNWISCDKDLLKGFADGYAYQNKLF